MEKVPSMENFSINQTEYFIKHEVFGKKNSRKGIEKVPSMEIFFERFPIFWYILTCFPHYFFNFLSMILLDRLLDN